MKKSTQKNRSAATAKAVARSSRKKSVQPKGISHHARRLYHITPKFVHGMVAGAVVGILTVGILGAVTAFNPTPASAAGNCDAHGIGDKILTNSTNNTAYTIKGNKATVTFNVIGKNCRLPITMVVWKAPNGTTGKPYSKQTLFFHTSQVFSEGRHSMTGTLPDCYFQVDTVTGTKLTGSTGQAFNYDKRQVAYMHGGTKKCVTTPPKPTPHPTPTPTPTPTPPPAPEPTPIEVCNLSTQEIVPIDESDFDSTLYSHDATVCNPVPSTPVVEAAAAPTELVNTGPGAIVIIAVLAVAGGAIFHHMHHNVKSSKHAKRSKK